MGWLVEGFVCLFLLSWGSKTLKGKLPGACIELCMEVSSLKTSTLGGRQV